MLRRARRWLPKRLSPTRALALFLLGVGVITLIGFQHVGTPQGSNELLVLSEGRGQASAITSRALQAVTHLHHSTSTMPHPPSQQHTLLLLDVDPSGSKALRDLQPQLAPFRKYPEAVTITPITGPAAVSMAAQFKIPTTSLPAVVYVPPMYASGGMFQSAATFTLGDKTLTPTAFMTWMKSTARLTLLLMNDWDGNEICFYYLDATGSKEVEIGCAVTQAEMWQNVALLDTFIARNKTTKEAVAKHVALFSGLFTVRSPQTCDYMTDLSCQLPKLPHPTDPVILEERKRAHVLRKQAMENQPKVVPIFTKVGFEKTRAPIELFEGLTGYLNASWDQLVRELWGVEDIFTNHFDAPSLKATLPEIGPFKMRLFAAAQKQLEQWIGGKTPLEPTAMYGVRVYSRNNTLALHCDRPDTHIISAIINVDQDVDEPWPLQIRDHAGKLHSVEMVPGDMVMYEGASCAHGRELPFKGHYFANTFVHFRPVQQAVQ